MQDYDCGPNYLTQNSVTQETHGVPCMTDPPEGVGPGIEFTEETTVFGINPSGVDGNDPEVVAEFLGDAAGESPIPATDAPHDCSVSRGGLEFPASGSEQPWRGRH
jgi:hypothetical protein